MERIKHDKAHVIRGDDAAPQVLPDSLVPVSWFHGSRLISAPAPPYQQSRLSYESNGLKSARNPVGHVTTGSSNLEMGKPSKSNREACERPHKVARLSSGATSGAAIVEAESSLEIDVQDNKDELKAKLKERLREKSDVFNSSNPEEDMLGEPGWKERCYEEKFSAKTPEEVELIRKDVILKYTEGLCWVMHYYYEGVRSWQWCELHSKFYPYHYAPFASDLKGLSELNKNFELGTLFKLFDQLLGVFPAASAHALPQPYRKLMTDPNSPIIDFYPSGTLENKCRNMSDQERIAVKEPINPKESGGMSGYISLCVGEPCPPIFRSPVAGMEDIVDNEVICAIYRPPDKHKHITWPPKGVQYPKKIVTVGDLNPEPILCHEDFGGRSSWTRRYNPPGSISGKQRGDSAHRLLVNSLQLKVESNAYEHIINGESRPYAATMDPRQSLLPYPMYDSNLGYHVTSRPMPAPPPRGPLHPSPHTPIPTQQYGYTQPYPGPSMYNSHHQSNSYGRNNHERPISHHYGRNNSFMAHGTGGSAMHVYQPSDANHNARFVNAQRNAPAYNGAFNNYHHGQHIWNFQSSRAPSHQQVHQNWVSRSNPRGGPREQGHPQQLANRYSQLDRRANWNQQPPPYYWPLRK